MKSLGKAQKIFIILLVINFVLAGGYYYMYHNISDTGARAGKLENIIKEKTIKVERFKAVKDRVKETEDARTKIDTYFIPAGGLVAFLNSFGKLGIESGVSGADGADIVVIEQTKSKVYENLKLNVTVTGDWKSVYKFLALIELLPYKVSIDSLTFEHLGLVTPEPSAKKKKVVALAKDLWQLSASVRILKLK